MRIFSHGKIEALSLYLRLILLDWPSKYSQNGVIYHHWRWWHSSSWSPNLLPFHVFSRRNIVMLQQVVINDHLISYSNQSAQIFFSIFCAKTEKMKDKDKPFTRYCKILLMETFVANKLPTINVVLMFQSIMLWWYLNGVIDDQFHSIQERFVIGEWELKGQMNRYMFYPLILCPINNLSHCNDCCDPGFPLKTF